MSRIRATSIAVAVVAALGLSACWPAPGQNPDRTAANGLESELNTASILRLTEVWDTAVGPGPVGPPVVAGGGIAVRSDVSTMTKVDAGTGALLWSWEPPEGAGIVDVSDPWPVGGRILQGWGTGGGGSYWSSSWVDQGTGADQGTAPPKGIIRSVRGNTVLVETTRYGSLTPVGVSFGLYDLATGTWVTGGFAALVGFGGSSPQWTLGRTAIFNSGEGLPSSPAATTSDTYVRSFPLVGITNTCGAAQFPEFACPTWNTDVGSRPTAPVVGPGGTTVYVGTAAGDVVALDAATGAIRWRAAVGAAVTQPPALADGALYVGTGAGKLVAVASAGCGSATCTPLWSASVGSGAVATQPAVGGAGTSAVVYAATASGDVAAMPATGCLRTTCQPTWTGSVGAAVSSGPIVSGGRVVVGTADGRLVAFGLPPA